MPLTGLPQEPIDGDGVRLRPYREGDVEDIATACADPLTQRFLSLLPHPYTATDARWWITEGSGVAWAAGGAAYAVADPATDRLIGAVGLDRINRPRASGEIGYWVAPWARGRGVATAATRALTDVAFAAGLARIEILTEWENTPSQRVALAAGYRREGVRRSAGAGRTGRHDLIAWVRLAGDPAGPTARLLPDLPAGRLDDGVVALRPLRPDDADFLFTLLSAPDVVATSVPPVPPERAGIEERCRQAEARWLAGERADLVITDSATGEPAGDIGLFYHEPPTGLAMIGYSMLPAWRGRGYPTRAARLLTGWAFTVGVSRMIAGTLPDNLGSQRVLEKAGFRREGYQRGRLPGVEGTRHDDVLFARLPGDDAG
ncbi:GNAT family N-acetyltransferase [Polymorphospora sp. NPDC050346]|uniref:GNAT family N-acetyltransferase n=1 Tax=Polymorphospora sp. NPDC050346 TaxID=3155780 RepID=UPI0033CC3BAD